MSHDEVHEPAPLRLLRPIEHDEEIRRQRHELEKHEEPERIVDRHNENHRYDEQVHVEPDFPDAATSILVEIREPVYPCRDSQNGDYRDQQTR